VILFVTRMTVPSPTTGAPKAFQLPPGTSSRYSIWYPIPATEVHEISTSEVRMFGRGPTNSLKPSSSIDTRPLISRSDWRNAIDKLGSEGSRHDGLDVRGNEQALYVVHVGVWVARSEGEEDKVIGARRRRLGKKSKLSHLTLLYFSTSASPKDHLGLTCDSDASTHVPKVISRDRRLCSGEDTGRREE
jgi:hypothetical protein